MPKRASVLAVSAIVIEAHIRPDGQTELELRVFGPLRGQDAPVAEILRAMAGQIERQLRAPGLLVPFRGEEPPRGA